MFDLREYNLIPKESEMEIVATKNSRPGWLRVHWKLVLAVWIGLALCGAIVAFVLMTNSAAAKLAIVTAKSNPALSQRLGQPITTGWFITGKIEVTPASGHAELAIPVSGPKAHGTIYSESRKRAGVDRKSTRLNSSHLGIS